MISHESEKQDDIALNAIFLPDHHRIKISYIEYIICGMQGHSDVRMKEHLQQVVTILLRMDNEKSPFLNTIRVRTLSVHFDSCSTTL